MRGCQFLAAGKLAAGNPKQLKIYNPSADGQQKFGVTKNVWRYETATDLRSFAFSTKVIATI